LREGEFRDKLVSDLQSSGINVVNMRGGTFDLVIEGKRPFVCEVKRIKLGGCRGFPEPNAKCFKYSEEQTIEILKMKFPPFVVAFYQKECYFLEPDWVKENVTDLKEFKVAIMDFNARQFPPAMTYAEVLKEIIKFVSNNGSDGL
jgi:hypothetical protein